MNKNQSGFSILWILVGVLVVGAILIAGFSVMKKDTTEDSGPKISKEAVGRDETRRKHAIQFATNLLTVISVQKQTVAYDQAGFDSFARLGSQKSVTDPLTAKPYSYNNDQLAMKVGEVVFSLNASCDDKRSDSKGKGLIIDSSSQSMAVAIKLESGNYACESNL